MEKAVKYKNCSLRLESEMLAEVEDVRTKDVEPLTQSGWARRAIRREAQLIKEGNYGYDQRTGESTAQ